MSLSSSNPQTSTSQRSYDVEIIVSRSTLTIAGLGTFQCAIGRSGIIAAAEKREGDGHTPRGSFKLRKLWYRPDVYPTPPATGLPVQAIEADDIWIDQSEHPLYNKAARAAEIPPGVSHEEMWREDNQYDIVVEIGYNDDPPVPGKGSAIFMHIAREGYLPTAGCVALQRADLEQVVARIGPETVIRIGEGDTLAALS